MARQNSQDLSLAIRTITTTSCDVEFSNEFKRLVYDQLGRVTADPRIVREFEAEGVLDKAADICRRVADEADDMGLHVKAAPNVYYTHVLAARGWANEGIVSPRVHHRT